MVLDPIFVTADGAADLLAITPFDVVELCERGDLTSQWAEDGRRLVRLQSVRDYADRLPTCRTAEVTPS